MDKIGRPMHLKGQRPVDCLKQFPCLRGWNGNHDAEDWLTVGSGRKIAGIKAFESRISSDDWDEWSKLLSPEFVNYVRCTKQIRYLCPKCSSHI